jgi:HSP20 family protein
MATVTSTLTHREPVSLLEELRSWVGAATTQPDIRVEEYLDGDRKVVRADLPGVDPTEDIRLEVEGHLLRLSAQRRQEKHEKARTEIRYGAFQRILTLPPGTAAEDVVATYKDGVLTVSFPVAPTGTSERIPVSREEPAGE